MDKLCYQTGKAMLPPTMLRTDFGPALSRGNLINTSYLSWPGIVDNDLLRVAANIEPKAQANVALVAQISFPQVVPESSVGLVEDVFEHYGSWNYREVREFLLQHLNVCRVLIASLPHIAVIFGKGTNVNLQVLVDHNGDGEAVLNALIQTPEAVGDALEKRRIFNRQWWSEARKITTNSLSFDIDCV